MSWRTPYGDLVIRTPFIGFSCSPPTWSLTFGLHKVPEPDNSWSFLGWDFGPFTGEIWIEHRKEAQQ